MNNKFTFVMAAIILTSSLAACSSNSNREYAQSTTVASSTAAYQANTARDAGGMVAEAPAVAEDMEYSALMGGGEAGAVSVSASSRMVVRTVNLTMQTMEFDAGVEDIEEIVAGYSGFMQESYVQGKSMYDKYGTRTANFTARIPAEKLDAFVSDMSGMFNITDKRQSGEDITDTYFDTDARLKTLKVQEERLLVMLEQAGELEYLLQVEKELANVRYEIERLTSSLQRMQNQVSMSTVYLYLQEVIEYTPVDPQPVTFGERIARTFKDSLGSFTAFVQGIALALIWLLPFLVLIAVLVAAVIIIAVSVGKRNKKRANASKDIPTHEPAQNDDNGSPVE